jgi:hypothetical protein
MSGMLEEDVDFLDWVQSNCQKAGNFPLVDFHPVDLDGCTDLNLPNDVNVAAVCVATLPKSNTRHKVHVVFILRSLAHVSLTPIESVMRVIADHLLPQGIQSDQLDIDLVDYSGFRCFGIARMQGNNVILARHEDRASLLPPLYSRMFAPRSRDARVQNANSVGSIT